MLSIHLSVHALSYSVIIINQSIHYNLSAGAQNTVYWESFTKENVRGFRESTCIRDHFLDII